MKRTEYITQRTSDKLIRFGRQQAIKEFEKKIDEWLKENTRGLDLKTKNELIFSYNDIEEMLEQLKQSLNNSQMDKSLKQDRLSVPLSDTSQLNSKEKGE